MANNLKTELNAARHRLQALEVRREVLCREQISAASAQRDLWLSDTADEKALTRAAQRLSTAEATLAGIDDALNVTRDKIAQLTADLAVAEDIEERERKAATLEGFVPELDASFAAVKIAVARFVEALGKSPIAEAVALRNWTGEFLGPAETEVPRLLELHRATARTLRATPTPSKQTPERPVPVLLPLPGRRGDLRDDHFVDWSSAEATRR
jgi:hypothetical protein